MQSIAAKTAGGALCGDGLEYLNLDVRLVLGSHLATTDPRLTFYSANDMTMAAIHISLGLDPIRQNISQPPISLLPPMICVNRSAACTPSPLSCSGLCHLTVAVVQPV